MPKENFLSRVGQWFMPKPPADVIDATEVSDAVTDERDQFQHTVSDRLERTSESLVTLQKSQSQVVNRLNDGFGELSDLVTAVQQHLEKQDNRADRIAGAVTAMADTVSRLPEAVGAQSQHMAAISERLEAVNDRAARWDETMSRIPSLAEAQRETLHALAERMESAQEGQASMVKSIDSFRDAVGTLSETSNASAASIRELQDAARDRDEHLMTMIADQNRRFTRLFVASVVLTVVIAGGAVALLFTQ